MGVETEINRLGPVIGAAAVDLSSADYVPPKPTRGVYVGVTGDLKVDHPDGSTVTYSALAGGVEHSLAVTKIYKTGTAASSILALF